MLKTLAIAATVAISAATAVTAPAMADRYCGPNFHYSRHWGECQPYSYYEPPGAVVGGAVAGAGYVAGSAVNAAGNVAGAAVNTAGAIAGGTINALTGR